MAATRTAPNVSNSRDKQENVGVGRNHRSDVQWVDRDEPSGAPVQEWASERWPDGSAEEEA